ncbi:MAG: CRISPR-associated protein Cas5 [Conexivisphaera sp.]
MRGLRFDVHGYMAHFRKVFSNSTSLSYFFPPRTTVTGILAAAMGLDRDSYYGEMSPGKLRVAVRVLTPLRKLTFSESYLNTDSVTVDAMRGFTGRVPTRREFVVAASADPGPLGYRIYLASDNAEYIERAGRALRAPAYPISLGPADMPAWVEDVEELECEPLDDPVGMPVASVVPSFLRPRVEEGLRISIEERVPRSFDPGRLSGRLENYYLELQGRPIRISGRFGGAPVDQSAPVGLRCDGDAVTPL